MKHRIIIKIDNSSYIAQLFDTPTAKKIYEDLPICGQATLWGEEIYFAIPVEDIALEADAREELEPGELGFWHTGNAFCIFFGKTPVSAGEKPRAYSPVNVFGKITSDISLLKTVPSGSEVIVEKYS